MLKLSSKDRFFIEFEFEFIDGSVSTYQFYERNTKDLSKMLDAQNHKESIEFCKEELSKNIKGFNVDRLLDEVIETQNIFDFRNTLDKEVAKAKEVAIKK